MLIRSAKYLQFYRRAREPRAVNGMAQNNSVKCRERLGGMFNYCYREAAWWCRLCFGTGRGELAFTRWSRGRTSRFAPTTWCPYFRRLKSFDVNSDVLSKWACAFLSAGRKRLRELAGTWIIIKTLQHIRNGVIFGCAQRIKRRINASIVARALNLILQLLQSWNMCSFHA